MLSMKQTIGRYIKLNDEDFPLTLNFNDFYYYEAVTGEHLLLHMLTGKRSMEFYITSNKFNILELINTRFEMDLESISIEGLYSATKNSEFFRASFSGFEGSSGYAGAMFGTMKINMEWLVDDLPETKKESVTRYIHNLCNLPDTQDININIGDGVNGYARPPTE